MLEERRAKGLKAPALDNRPDLESHVVWVWNAFQQLNSCRQFGMAVGPIPWTAVNEYAMRHGIVDMDDFEEFRFLIVAMDETFLSHNTRKQKATEAQQRGKR
jgi:hypothetical protein